MAMERDDEQGGGGLIPSEPPAPESEPKKLEIDLVEADEEAAAAEEEQPKQPEQRPIRHKSQWRQMNEKHAREAQELREKIAALEARVSAQPREVQREAPQPTKREETSDPREREVQQIWRMQQRTLAAIRSGQYADAEVREMEDDWRQMDRRRRSIEGAIDSGQSQRQQPQGLTEHDFEKYMLRASFPQIFNKESLRKLADAEFETLKEQGWPDDMSTAREACERVANRKGIGRKPPPPSDAEKARHAGVPGRAGATANGADDKYRPSTYIMGLARAYTAHLPDMTDEERYKHWRRYVGKKEGLVP
jgi:hypothetical protein